jgi:hypothetical protein
MAVALTSFLLLLAPSAFAQDTTADDAQALLERELGFELPPPYRFVESHATPLYVHCNEPEGSGCLEGERGHWVISGTVGQGLFRDEWQDVPQFDDLLIRNGWEIEETTTISFPAAAAKGEPSTVDVPETFIRRDRSESGACFRRIVRNRGNLDAIGMTLEFYPCETTE